MEACKEAWPPVSQKDRSSINQKDRIVGTMVLTVCFSKKQIQSLSVDQANEGSVFICLIKIGDKVTIEIKISNSDNIGA